MTRSACADASARFRGTLVPVGDALSDDPNPTAESRHTTSLVPSAVQDTTLTRIEDLDPERALAFIEDYRRFRRYGTLGAVFGVAAPFLYFTLFRGGTQFGGFGGMLFMVAGGLARRFAVRLALRGNHIAASLQPEVERRLVLRPQWTATTKTRIKPPITIDDQVRALCAPVIDDARPPSETA